MSLEYSTSAFHMSCFCQSLTTTSTQNTWLVRCIRRKPWQNLLLHTASATVPEMLHDYGASRNTNARSSDSYYQLSALFSLSFCIKDQKCWETDVNVLIIYKC